MSIPEKSIVNGKLQYNNRWYKVLNAPLSDEIAKKLETYRGDRKWIDPAAPWKPMPLIWKMEEGKLYLVKLYIDGLLEELTDSERIFASWVNELKLFVDDRTICRTHESQENYIEEHTILHLSFDKGIFLREEKQTELFTSPERKENTNQYPVYTTVHMNSNDLLVYMEDDIRSDQDQLLPVLSDLIYQMIDEDDDICLDMADLKNVLQKGDTSVLVSAKGRDIDLLAGSLISSVTDEGLLNPKGCLMHLRISKKYPRRSVAKIIEKIDEGLKFNFEPLEPDMKEPFYVGTRLVHGLADDEVAIRMLVSI